jgi:nitroreductase
MKLSLYNLKIRIQNDYLIPLMYRHRKLADLYYFLFSSDFSREHQKVMTGKYMHLQALKKGKPNAFHLRREIHRLEKGLVMRNRRSVFGLAAIKDVVKNYNILKDHDNPREIDSDLLLWAKSVIHKYFESVDGNHAVIKEAKEMFYGKEQAASLDLGTQPKAVPYLRQDSHVSNISYEDFYQLAMQRRSVRWFQDKPVPHDLVEKAMLAATQSPSACNRQPFEFKVFDQKELKDKVGEIPMGIRGIYSNVPMFAVVVGKLSAYLSERDRHVIYIDGGLASMSFMFALETLGLSSFPINWPDIESLEQKMEKILNLEADERPMMLIGIGFADPQGGIPFSQKKSPAQLISYN